MGQPEFWKSAETTSHWSHLRGIPEEWSTCFLHCRWYDCFAYSAFVTGDAPRWSSVLSPVTPEKTTRLRTSGCWRDVILQWAFFELCDCFVWQAKALRVFISTHTELTAQEILNIYAKRWNIEVFFRSCKQKLAFDKCQLRKKQGITRMWLILSFIHFLCCTVSGCVGSFDEGYNYFRNYVLQEIFAQNALSM